MGRLFRRNGVKGAVALGSQLVRSTLTQQPRGPWMEGKPASIPLHPHVTETPQMLCQAGQGRVGAGGAGSGQLEFRLSLVSVEGNVGIDIFLIFLNSSSLLLNGDNNCINCRGLLWGLKHNQGC